MTRASNQEGNLPESIRALIEGHLPNLSPQEQRRLALDQSRISTPIVSIRNNRIFTPLVDRRIRVYPVEEKPRRGPVEEPPKVGVLS